MTAAAASTCCALAGRPCSRRRIASRTVWGKSEAFAASVTSAQPPSPRAIAFFSNHLGQRLAARIDPSDGIQEALFEAERGLPDYIRDRPVPFFVCLRTIARDRLVWWTRRHTAKKRDAFRDLALGFRASDAAAQTLVDRLVDSGTIPSGCAIREEERARALALLGRLGAADRRVLEPRYLDGLSIAEIASTLGIGLGTAQMRHVCANGSTAVGNPARVVAQRRSGFPA
jgi:DNA-directed RNA polymerase specialized sigma24 family protein